MIGACLAFALGVGGFFLLREMPSLWLGPALLLVLSVSARWAGAPAWTLAFALGFMWAQTHALLILRQSFPDDLAGVSLVVEGRVASIPERPVDRTRFLLRIQGAWRDGEPAEVGGLVRLGCYRDCPDLRAGERWRLTVRLKPRHGYASPGGFDFERWLFEHAIQATGYVREPAAAVRLASDAGGYWLLRVRQMLGDHLTAVLADPATSGVVRALTIGDRSGVSRDDWDALRRTGTSHLFAISGLHIGLIAAGVYFLTRRLWGYSRRATLALAAPRGAAVAAAAAALGYAGLAGFAISTQRALIMLAVVLGAVVLARTLRPFHALSLALGAVLAWDPIAVLSYGFWLSFGAVGILALSLGTRLPARDAWTRWVQPQWAIGLGLLPLLLLLFAEASVIAPVVNLVAVPLFSLLILPLVLISTLLSLVPGLSLPLVASAELVRGCLDALAWLAEQPWATMRLAERPLWAWGAGLFGGLVLLAPRGMPARWLGGPLMLPMLLLRPPAPEPGEVWVTLLDVGQGLAMVAQTAEGTLVYDAGPRYPSGFETGTHVVAPFLASQGVDRVDRLVISHADSDHAGGVAGLANALPIRRIQSGEPDALEIQPSERCQAGDRWSWAGVSFTILHPPREEWGGWKGNNASCVLKIATGGASLLVTGDAERGVERALVERYGAELDADILIAGHHGSRTSSSAELVQAVSPRWILFSSGYANRFRLPAPEVVGRGEAAGAAMLDTARSGAIGVAMGPRGIEDPPWGWRERHGRLWTHRPERLQDSGQAGTDEDQ